MADNNFFFKVLAELSDTEYFTFLFFSPLTVKKLPDSEVPLWMWLKLMPGAARHWPGSERRQQERAWDQDYRIPWAWWLEWGQVQYISEWGKEAARQDSFEPSNSTYKCAS